MVKALNTRSKKFLNLRQFILKNIKDSYEVYIKSRTCIESGWLFSVYTHRSGVPIILKITYNNYHQHKGDWNMDMTISSKSTHLGNGFYGHEIIPCAISEALLNNI